MMKACPLIASGLLLTAGLALAAAGSAPPQTSPFGETIDVRVVNIEAVATDRKGRPVRGLGAADFRLLVDGHEVPIGYFTEVVAGETAAAPVGSGAEALPPPPSAGSRVGRSYLVFIDNKFSIAAQRDLVLRSVEEDLKLLGTEDRMAVVTFDGTKLDLLSGWTGDTAALSAAFAQARKSQAWGNQVLAERRWEEDDQDILALAGEGAAGEPVPTLQEVIAAEALLDGKETGGVGAGGKGQKHYSWLRKVADAAAAALRGVPPPPPSRKVMLLLSGGWPVPHLFAPLARDANRLGYTLYPVDVAGIDAMSSDHSVTLGWEDRAHATLEVLAAATGGRAALNTARLGGFERAVEDSASYYWLGFTPTWKGEDKHHIVRVEARRPELAVRSRRSFSDLSLRSEESLRIEGLLLFCSSAGFGDQRLIVELGTPRRRGSRTVELPVTLAIPAGLLTPIPAVPGGEGWTAEAILSMGALDTSGARSDLPAIPVRLKLPQAPRPGQYARYRATLQLRHAEQRLVFSLRDRMSGNVLWKEVEFRPAG